MLAPLITGQVPSDEGSVLVAGVAIPNCSPRAAIRAGMAFVPIDRARLGVIPLASVRTNTTVSDLLRHWRGGRLRQGEEVEEVTELVGRLRIKTSSTETQVAALSGI